jgi:hypothetical protein
MLLPRFRSTHFDVNPPQEFYSSLFPSWEFKEPTEAKLAMWSFAAPSGLFFAFYLLSQERNMTKVKQAVGF